MLLERIYDEKLAQASYLLGCEATGQALVVDANRDVEQYERLAAARGCRVTHVTETHIHADFVSGSRELAARTGAQLYLSGEGGDAWRYEFAADAGARLVHNGDVLTVGDLRIEVMHTPGHTPEHVCFVVTDATAANTPVGAFTGDFLFVGDVGRPDLLEKAANVAGTMEAGARDLFRSLREFSTLQDYLQIWPGHGAGSACGKSLGALPQSTLGYERIANWALQTSDESHFIASALQGQPDPPAYFARMKRINREGPPLLGGFQMPRRLELQQLSALLDRGTPVVDVRRAADYAAGFIPGTLNIPLNRSFNTYAGWLLPYDTAIALVADESTVYEAVRDLALVGFDEVAGFCDASAISEWRAAGRRPGTVPQASVHEVVRAMAENGVAVLDVRTADEWEAGHIPGARNIPVGHLAGRLDEIPRDTPVIVHCQTGGRSAIAASVLRANGFAEVTNFTGGFGEWERSGGEVERG